MSNSQNIQVIVRLRPFSEKERSNNSKSIVEMTGPTTYLLSSSNPKEKPKEFTFDKSYWSHDGYEINDEGYCRPVTSKYVDQLKVYTEVGAEMLKSAWQGYNCSLFAYGQTGSGKSYTVMGYRPNFGLVPNMCKNLFLQIRNSTQENVEYKVTFSMLEIYNEEIRDLLSSQKDRSFQKLRVREKNDKGFYVDHLTVRPVNSYEDIQASLAEGEKNRTIAATKMNETSSRAHTIVTINFHQNKQNNITTFSAVNLVDLAGSERQSQTGATGDRFKESTNINQSLSTLGNVLKALCDKEKGLSVNIPYRDSNLTKLLKNALGGNSKTAMIVAISPAAENYEQTLSSLRYADRAKAIRTHAKINESDTDKLIKELLSEKESLLRELELSRQKITVIGMSDKEVAELKQSYEDEIKRYKKEMEDAQKSWEVRLAEEKTAAQQRIKEMDAEQVLKKSTPYIWNLNEDPSLCNKIIHFIEGSKSIGNYKSNPDIILSGPSIHPQHAVIKLSEGRISVIPKNGKVYVNGSDVTEKKRLHHNDRLCFGASSIFVLCDPKKLSQLKKKDGNADTISYDFAQRELAKTVIAEIEEEDEVLKQEVLSLLSQVRDANAISSQFGKDVNFEIILVSPLAKGKSEGRTEAYVKVINNAIGTSYLWDKSKFLQRQSVMMELYQWFEESGDHVINNLDYTDDPFFEDPDTDCLVGIVAIPLITLSQMEAYDDTFDLLNYEAERVGHIKIILSPCDQLGRDMNYNIEQSIELVGRNLHFKIKVEQAMGLPQNYKQTWCSFKFFNNPKPYVSPAVAGSNPKYLFETLISIKQASHEFLHYLENGDITLEIWGHQKMNGNNRSSPVTANMATAKLRSEIMMLKESLNKVSSVIESRRPCEACEEVFFELERIISQASCD